MVKIKRNLHKRQNSCGYAINNFKSSFDKVEVRTSENSTKKSDYLLNRTNYLIRGYEVIGMVCLSKTAAQSTNNGWTWGSRLNKSILESFHVENSWMKWFTTKTCISVHGEWFLACFDERRRTQRRGSVRVREVLALAGKKNFRDRH